MKRYLIYFAALCLMMTMLPFSVPATETEAEAEAEAEVVVREPGMCGENLHWSYADGVLTISGSGEMDPFAEGMAPWQTHKEDIRKVVLSGSVASVGDYAFTDYDAIEAVEFGNSLHTVGKRAFKSCDNLTRIVLPDTFRKFDEECFMSCKRLGEIWCRGGMPSFKTSCVWDISATIFYPPSKAWPAEYVIPLGDAFRWQIQFQAMDVPEEYLTVSETAPAAETEQTDPVQTEPVQTETQAPVETVPETTAPETVPVTEAAAVHETEPVPTEETKPAWLEEMEQLEQGQEAVKEAPAERQSIGIGLIVGLCILIIILLLILIGAPVFRRRDY